MFNSRFRWLWLSGSLLFLILVVFPHFSYADTAANNGLDKIVNAYRLKASGWESVLSQYAQNIFWILALLEFAWTGIKLAVKGADLGEILSEILSHILFVGFFFWLLTNSTNISHNIVDSLRTAASSANAAIGGTPGIAPSDIFDTGMEILKKITSSLSVWEPGDSIMLALAGLAVLVGFTMMAAFLIMAMVESYFIISASVIMMGFGGSHWTKDYAVNTLRYTLSVGAKLFLAQLVIGIGQSFINDLALQAQTSDMSVNDAWYIAGISLIFMALTKAIPDMACGWVRGDSHATGSHLTGMVTAAAAAGVQAGLAAGSAMTGGGGALHGAANFAGERMKSQDAQAQQSFLRRALDTGSATARELKNSTQDNAMKHWRGETQGGNFGAQVGHMMSQRAEAMKEMREQKAESSSSSKSGSSSEANKENKIFSD
jgi:type IV secretion system protein TrbL